MKRPKLLLSMLAICIAACTVLPNGKVEPSQAAINATTASYQALDQAILAALAAERAGSLKGADAKRTLDAFVSAKVGLDLALTTLRAANAASTAASGVTK